MRTTSRRSFLQLSAALLPLSAHAESDVTLTDRISGLLYGSAIGDALGGPIEFQSTEAIAQLRPQPKVWQKDELFDAEAAIERLQLRPYAPLRPKSESYGQWGENAPAGTITDDTRHKLILLEALHQSKGAPNKQTLAKVYMDWPSKALSTELAGLNQDWLEEWRYASAWVLGIRDPTIARPPERLWQGLPTCCGQMTSLPLAALYPGKPVNAYRACYELSYFDNSWGKDVNAALVAGLSTALAGKTWPEIIQSIQKTDPYHYGNIRYTTRQVDHWLDLALKLSTEAEKKPAKLFASLEKTFAQTIKWEAQVPFVVAISCLALADYDPLAALQLTTEWGHDTDSYASLLGAFVGAKHGVKLFPDHLRTPVHERLMADFDVDFSKEAQFLGR